ncbi:MAG: hypothetical protein HW401_106 [Parcubacteria group bacterium]|nr:hypothetical protein [Parcubacteria group bacterium]
MIAVALFFDGIQAGIVWIYLIPFVGFILAWTISTGVSIFAFLTFSLWFHLAGLKFNSKIAASTVGAFFIELIPGLSALPAWTLSIVVTFLFFQTKKVASKIAPRSEKLLDSKSENTK